MAHQYPTEATRRQGGVCRVPGDTAYDLGCRAVRDATDALGMTEGPAP
ncbi:MAG: hypothetical protein JF622_04795 [Terrabacter sp.]|nr:hypothetical protein [Terrabacter sp.]